MVSQRSRSLGVRSHEKRWAWLVKGQGYKVSEVMKRGGHS